MDNFITVNSAHEDSSFDPRDVDWVISEDGFVGYLKLIERGLKPSSEHLRSAIYYTYLDDTYLDLVEYLLNEGVDPNEKGWEAFDWVIDPDYDFDPNIIEILFRYGAVYNSKKLKYLEKDELDIFMDIKRKYDFRFCEC